METAKDKTMILVPICRLCGKPHFGRKKKEERCQCDISGYYSEVLIEKEV